MLHAVEQGFKARRPGCLKTLFIFADELQGIIGLVKASLEYGEPFGVHGALAQIAHAQIVLIDDASRVVSLNTGQDIEQRTLARTITGDKPYTLPLGHTKRYAREEHQVAKRLGESVDLQIRNQHEAASSIRARISSMTSFISISASSSPCLPKSSIGRATQVSPYMSTGASTLPLM